MICMDYQALMVMIYSFISLSALSVISRQWENDNERCCATKHMQLIHELASASSGILTIGQVEDQTPK